MGSLFYETDVGFKSHKGPGCPSGLDILDFEMHSSGNPVPWDVENGAEHSEYLSMLHVKKGDYAHWAIRINRATRRITHVSAGPVIKARDYRNEVHALGASRHLLDCGLAEEDMILCMCCGA